MATVCFIDGSLLSGPTFRDLERQLREDPWNPDDKQAFRVEMARRAYVWSLTNIWKRAPSRYFFAELESAGMCRVLDEEETA